MLNLVIHVNPVLIHVITHVIQISGLLMCHMKLFFINCGGVGGCGRKGDQKVLIRHSADSC
jgi:hypothetical protein